MPNYYAHLQFGAQVLDALPGSLRAGLEEERDAYTLGQYGPDPLFFCFTPGGGAARAVGHAAHRKPARTAMEALRQAIQAGVPFAAGYGAGFLCHFALDSCCHAPIRRWEREEGSKMAHTHIETELDRFLMARSGLDPAKETPLPTPRLPGAFYEMLERYVYPGATGRQYRRGLVTYRRLSAWHTRTAGSKPAGWWMDRAVRLLPRSAALRDMALKRQAGDRYAGCARQLRQLLQAQVPVAAEKLAAFLQGYPLDEWYDRDFFGQKVLG